MSNTNILFYSNKCEGSQTLLSMMKSENLIKYFLQVCTDNNKNLPALINNTPTLIIKGIPTPYVGGDAFVWLSQVKQWKLKCQVQKIANMQNQTLTTANLTGGQTTNLLGFSDSEMSGISDLFGYLEDGKEMPHSYVNYNQIGQDNILTPSNENPNDKITITKHKELNRNLETLRKQQDDIFKKSVSDLKRNLLRNK